ncbi:Cytochrome c oxidase assembly protein cox18, mitochondrial [Lunasporangiospora selenospora]|uniref:Cytochrome c oxidase assembly protein cox18, mitochondrial n=1 Tax=Lunasporangiospora selenospora TaxID=979761 RepID=A0A9P6KGB6_9FUNG|nr:Cytochrome c oxidase assembly protein cox18, mitochondrial [Lunasporangiospora selenospora]
MIRTTGAARVIASRHYARLVSIPTTCHHPVTTPRVAHRWFSVSKGAASSLNSGLILSKKEEDFDHTSSNIWSSPDLIQDIENTTLIPDIVPEPTSINAILAGAHFLLEGIHSAGLPWWATIFSATFLLRTTITAPVAIYQQRAIGRMMTLTPVLQAWLETLKASVRIDHKIKGHDFSTYNSEIQKAYRAKVKELYSAHHCNPRVSFLLPWVQIPLFVAMSLTIRGMAGYPLPFLGDSSLPIEAGFIDGGVLWFTDLTAPDPTWIMPIAIGAANLLNVELNGMMLSKTPTRQQVIFRNVFRVLSISMIPIAHITPTAIGLYWLSSGCYSVAQNLAFRVPRVRQWLKLPALPKKIVGQQS